MSSGGATPKTSDSSNFAGGTIPWLTPADLSGYTAKHIGNGSRFITQKGLASSSARMMPAGTILFTSRAPIGYVVIASNEICTNQGFKSFVLKSKDILSDYVYWWLKGSKDLAESLASGTTFLELSGANAKQLPIPIAPLSQQTRIVAEIEKQFSRLDEAVANLKRVKANLKRYKATVLKAAVEGKLTEEWRRGAIHRAQQSDDQGAMNCAPTQPIETGAELLERILSERRKAAGKGKYKEPVGPDTSGLPELPAGWVWASINQLATKVTDGTHHTPKYVADGIAFISVKDIRGGKISFEACKYIALDAHKDLIARCNPEFGDVLITKSGTIGRTAVVNTDRPFSLFVSVALVKPVPRLINEMYLRLALDYYILNIDISQDIKGGLLKNLHLEDLRIVNVQLPPLAEQHQLVAEVERRLSIVAGAEAQVDANLRRADRLRQSILKQAFSGQLVPQDPNDEPASVLLEHIRNAVGARFIAPKTAPVQSRKTEPEPSGRAQSIAPLHQSDDFACLDDVTAAILAHMQPGREYARAELADVLGLSTGRWNAAIQDLKRVGKVRQTGEKRGARYVLK